MDALDVLARLRDLEARIVCGRPQAESAAVHLATRDAHISYAQQQVSESEGGTKRQQHCPVDDRDKDRRHLLTWLEDAEAVASLSCDQADPTLRAKGALLMTLVESVRNVTTQGASPVK